MQRLEVSGAVRPLDGSLGFKGLKTHEGLPVTPLNSNGASIIFGRT